MRRKMRRQTNNPVEVYTRTRRIVFSQMLKDPDEAKRWLEGYRQSLGPAGYIGLKAEVAFFEQYRQAFELVLAADVGDATDFVGMIDGVLHRIDVTTNSAFKQLQSYEPLQLQGARYKIAVLDQGKFDLIDINFPFCPNCKTGRILPTGMLLEENTDAHGNSQWSNDQLQVDICSACGESKVTARITTPFLYDFTRVYDELNAAKHEAEDTDSTPIDVCGEAKAYARRASRYLSDAFGTRLVAVGGKHYEITDPRDADGYWLYKFEDQLPLVSQHLQDAYPWDIEVT